ncbi:MAG: C40 family peptidase [Corynebacterium sp.]|nr:C40 family peptidase [Corynebacterium sp.]
MAANAAEVTVPGTDIAVDIAGIENIPGVAEIPGIEQWVPSLADQAGSVDYQAILGADAYNALVEQASQQLQSLLTANGVNSEDATKVAGLDSALGGFNIPDPAAAVSDVASAANTVGQQIVAAARSKIGSPYAYGSAGPNAFDCSGLTSWAYAQVGKSIPRTSQAQSSGGIQVSRDQLQPGDIIAYYSGASHVAIYTGNGTVIHAVNSGTPVKEDSIDYMPYYNAVRF